MREGSRVCYIGDYDNLPKWYYDTNSNFDDGVEGTVLKRTKDGLKVWVQWDLPIFDFSPSNDMYRYSSAYGLGEPQHCAAFFAEDLELIGPDTGSDSETESCCTTVNDNDLLLLLKKKLS